MSPPSPLTHIIASHLALTPGTRLGVYEIAAQIGEGGMGAVYRGTDTTLGRQVAIKILPDAFASDPERLARFEREAKTLASLNHPHIAAIYGFEKSGGTHALVMELVEGDDLSQRIARGAIPIDEALPIAKQIAEALEAAHEQGIVHRDLKPANIKVRADGTVKVLDFGLAKAVEDVGSRQRAVGSATPSMAPTINPPALMTGAGMILGTAAYMAPEQARGKTVDRRADIWAFGVVLFEMLTGQRAFSGEDVADVLSRVLQREPDFDALPPATPARVAQVLRVCLRKDLKQRAHDMADVRLALDGAFETTGPQARDSVVASPAAVWRRPVPLALAASLVTALVVGLVGVSLRPPVEPRAVSRLEFGVPEVQEFRDASGRGILAISPDGGDIAYSVGLGLRVRAIGELEARTVPGTGTVVGNPFFSPDGESVGFWDVATGELKRVAVRGGTPSVVCRVELTSGASWSRDNTMLFGAPEGIFRVSANGGTPELVIPAQAGAENMWGPQLLPDGESVLFTLRSGATTAWDQAQLVAQSLRTGERTVVWQGGSDVRYVPTGHLVFVQGSTLYAMAFDPDRLEAHGAPVPVVQGVRREGLQVATAQYAVSNAGTLVYVPGAASDLRTLALVDRSGTVHPLDLPPGAYIHPRLSPDGAQLTVGTEDGGEVWVYDLRSRGALRRLTFGGGNFFPIWTLDGQYITFQSNRDGDRAIYRQRADGSGSAERVTRVASGDAAHEPESWSPDGTLSFDLFGATGGQGVWTLPAGGDRTPTRFVDEPAIVEKHSAFSPDGRWLAYMDSTEQPRVFVQPFPPTGALYQLSPDGGRAPVWSRDGRELFYHDQRSNRLLVVRVTTSPGVTFSAPTALPIEGTVHPLLQRNFDVTPDGQQVLVVLPASTDGDTRPRIQVVQNWFEELTRLVSTASR